MKKPQTKKVDKLVVTKRSGLFLLVTIICFSWILISNYVENWSGKELIRTDRSLINGDYGSQQVEIKLQTDNNPLFVFVDIRFKNNQGQLITNNRQHYPAQISYKVINEDTGETVFEEGYPDIIINVDINNIVKLGKINVSKNGKYKVVVNAAVLPNLSSNLDIADMSLLVKGSSLVLHATQMDEFLLIILIFICFPTFLFLSWKDTIANSKGLFRIPLRRPINLR
jgi:hypothetical protein